MSEEEFEDLLKDIPITNNMISSYSTINVEDIRKAIDRFKYVPSYRDLLEENNELKAKIDKAIDMLDLIIPELWNISNAMTYKIKEVKRVLGDKE